MRPYIEREFENPDEVVTLIKLLLDGVRIARLRVQRSGIGLADSHADWRVIHVVLNWYPRNGDATGSAIEVVEVVAPGHSKKTAVEDSA